MNAAVNEGRDFAEVFAGLTDGEDLEALREKFDVKAFQRRQEAVINALMDAGHSTDDLARMTLAELQTVEIDDPEWDRLRLRYVDILTSRGVASGPLDFALRTHEGESLPTDGFRDYLNALRSVRINMEFSGALCRGLKQTRYKQVETCDGEPTLVDFMLDRVPGARPMT